MLGEDVEGGVAEPGSIERVDRDAFQSDRAVKCCKNKLKNIFRGWWRAEDDVSILCSVGGGKDSMLQEVSGGFLAQIADET